MLLRWCAASARRAAPAAARCCATSTSVMYREVCGLKAQELDAVLGAGEYSIMRTRYTTWQRVHKGGRLEDVKSYLVTPRWLGDRWQLTLTSRSVGRAFFCILMGEGVRFVECGVPLRSVKVVSEQRNLREAESELLAFGQLVDSLALSDLVKLHGIAFQKGAWFRRHAMTRLLLHHDGLRGKEFGYTVRQDLPRVWVRLYECGRVEEVTPRTIGPTCSVSRRWVPPHARSRSGPEVCAVITPTHVHCLQRSPIAVPAAPTSELADADVAESMGEVFAVEPLDSALFVGIMRECEQRADVPVETRLQLPASHNSIPLPEGSYLLGLPERERTRTIMKALFYKDVELGRSKGYSVSGRVVYDSNQRWTRVHTDGAKETVRGRIVVPTMTSTSAHLNVRMGDGDLELCLIPVRGDFYVVSRTKAVAVEAARLGVEQLSEFGEILCQFPKDGEYVRSIGSGHHRQAEVGLRSSSSSSLWGRPTTRRMQAILHVVHDLDAQLGGRERYTVGPLHIDGNKSSWVRRSGSVDRTVHASVLRPRLSGDKVTLVGPPCGEDADVHLSAVVLRDSVSVVRRTKKVRLTCQGEDNFNETFVEGLGTVVATLPMLSVGTGPQPRTRAPSRVTARTLQRRIIVEEVKKVDAQRGEGAGYAVAEGVQSRADWSRLLPGGRRHDVRVLFTSAKQSRWKYDFPSGNFIRFVCIVGAVRWDAFEVDTSRASIVCTSKDGVCRVATGVSGPAIEGVVPSVDEDDEQVPAVTDASSEEEWAAFE